MKFFYYSLIALTALTVSGCGGGQGQASADNTSNTSTAIANTSIMLDVYKSETCGCCGVWVEYMNKLGYSITIHHPEDLNAVKEELGIAPQWQSCHTAVTKDGYLFEGHIPEKYVKQFLASTPENALGLAVPGMPLGSPGMEMGDRFTPYQIVLLNKDGSTSNYATIASAAEQF